MKVEFAVEVNKKIYEISELVKSVSYSDKLNDGCSKLEFSYIDDNLKIENGSIVRFQYDGTGIFYGSVFKHEKNNKGEIKVTAYDQLRYCKAKDSINVRQNTVADLVKRMCTYFGLRQGIISDTKYILPTKAHDGDTWLDIVYDAIKDTLVNKGEWYVLRDEFGTVALRNILELQTNFVLGDESLCYDFSHSKSIDNDFYNQIKILWKGDTSQESTYIGNKDIDSIKKYGVLQYYDEIDKSKYNAAQANELVKILMKLYGQEMETLSLECLGNTSIRAGSIFIVKISDADISKQLFVRSVTHKFLPIHTMSLEVAI